MEARGRRGVERRPIPFGLHLASQILRGHEPGAQVRPCERPKPLRIDGGFPAPDIVESQIHGQSHNRKTDKAE